MILVLALLGIAFVLATIRILGVPMQRQLPAHRARRSTAVPIPRKRASWRLLLALFFIAAGTALLVLIALRWFGGLLERLVS